MPSDFKWKILEHRETPRQFTWNPSRIKLFQTESQKRNGIVEGNVIRKEFASIPGVMNASVLNHLLKHPELIPDKWKGYYIFFWGTIYEDKYGWEHVRCLEYCLNRKMWCWDNNLLNQTLSVATDFAAVLHR